jgi:acetyl-CoA C-acetyltransferase
MSERAETTPVIVAVGEYTDRPAELAQALEPVDLMARALRACEADAGATLLQAINHLSLVGLISWPYRDPAALLCERLSITPQVRVNGSMGGETPIRLAHEAAIRIARGEPLVAAVVGGEASHSLATAQKLGRLPPWTPPASREEAVRFPSSRFAMSAPAKRLKVMDPAQIYPFYEMAAQAAWRQAPAEAQAASAHLWARYAAVAADNPNAWIRTAPDALSIATVSAGNRLIHWPYPKLMVANPLVNQAGGFIIASLARARAMGVPDDRLIHLWGGAAAKEPEDYLLRDRYDHSTAQSAALQRAVELVGGDARRFTHLELYSCFPIVPKMALRTLGLPSDGVAPTVAGGLTFFGGPLNNYMSHAVAAMVRALRADANAIGLLYGQGGYVNKHHTLVASASPPAEPIALEYSVQSRADARRGSVPPLLEDYVGEAAVETFTVSFARDGSPERGLVIARTADGGRALALVPVLDAENLAALTSTDASAVGRKGRISPGPDGLIFQLLG